MGLQEVGWIDLAEDRNRWRAVLNEVINPQIPQSAGKFLISSRPMSFSGNTLLRGVGRFVGWLFS